MRRSEYKNWQSSLLTKWKVSIIPPWYLKYHFYNKISTYRWFNTNLEPISKWIWTNSWINSCCWFSHICRSTSTVSSTWTRDTTSSSATTCKLKCKQMLAISMYMYCFLKFFLGFWICKICGIRLGGSNFFMGGDSK